MQYQILARYDQSKPFGEWQVGIFNDKKQAQAYIDRTVTRYHNQYGHYNFEMRMTEVTKEQGKKFNEMLQSLID